MSEAKRYIITRENGKIIISMTTYEMFSFSFKEIENSLKSIGFCGFFIVDNLPSLDIGENRFIKVYFDGQKIERNKTEIYIPKIKFIKERNDFYRQQEGKYLKHSIMSAQTIEHFLSGFNYFELHKKPSIHHIMLSIKKPLFNQELWDILLYLFKKESKTIFFAQSEDEYENIFDIFFYKIIEFLENPNDFYAFKNKDIKLINIEKYYPFGATFYPEYWTSELIPLITKEYGKYIKQK